jgi:nucleotide-binding universal stress UspA family protein
LAHLRLLASGTAVRVRTHPVQSDPVDAITRVAAEEAADLVVVGT